jgi:hypothetical protein
MSKQERHHLFHVWETSLREELNQRLTKAVRTHKSIKERFDAITEESNLRCLRTSNVIGLTTSGLARNLGMLRKLNSRVLVCEEAGEVLEAHLLTTFLPSIQHAILIGDHQQLRPQIQNNDLSSANQRGKQYSLDISLFERLVEPSSGVQSLPYSTLETQRRMHPSISRLIRETLYPALQDADTVESYPEVIGMKHRLFWLDHMEPEAPRQHELDTTSHWNPFEVEMTAALVSHLVNQGSYQPDEIAVLTPYLGQLQHLRAALSKVVAIVLGERDLEDLDTAGIDISDADKPTMAGPEAVNKTTLLRALRIATIDNFQGEEAKVIVISLVRSNPQNKCGFLNASNRINVTLSRAQHGMYIIGNSHTASFRVQMWADVVAMLTADGNIGTSLELQCPRHPETPISVTVADDFSKVSPEGGCNLKCVDRLHCGHACLAKCHAKVLHNAVRCLEPCPRPLKGCDHTCPGYCGDACPKKCQVIVRDASRVLTCGHHVETLPCWQSQDTSLVDCRVQVQRTVPGCEHVVTMFCYVDEFSDQYACNVPCGAHLPCGHSCKNKCKACTTRNLDGTATVFDTKHVACKQVCGRAYTNCAHSCTAACHGSEPCAPCAARCENSCSHSRCGKLCSEPCRPCAEERCASGCPHSKCSMPCSAPCNHTPCDKRCSEVLSCGHQCKSMRIFS